MKLRIAATLSIAGAIGIAVAAQQPGGTNAGRRVEAPADLSGTWLYSAALPPVGLKRTAGGAVTVKSLDASGLRPAENAPGALPSTPAPSYKPEFRAKVKDLSDHESKVDPVFYCGRPGVPRVGPPRRIVQLPNEMIFLYEDMSGDAYRIIPTDGRGHRADANPTTYGDSVAHWEGKTLVVDATNFVDDTWFGEDGYFHTDAMHVTERLWRNGANLVYQVTVDDPKVLTAPWTMAPRVVKPSTEPLEESPRCVETDASKLVNDDHHRQR